MALYLSAELTKTHSFRLFFGDFAHWEEVIARGGLLLELNNLAKLTRIEKVGWAVSTVDLFRHIKTMQN